MGRKSKPWRRGDRGWWSTVHRRQVYLSHDKREAQRALDALLKSSSPILPGQYSVAQLVTLFLADCERRVAKRELSPETFKTHQTYLLRWSEACRRVRPEHLRVYHLDAWCESHDTWNQTTISTAISRVKTWAAFIKRKGYVDYNHLRDALPPTKLTRSPAEPGDLLRLGARDRLRCLPRFLFRAV